jgi:hypothetical protein
VRTVYVGYERGTCGSRLRALRKIEPDVELFDSTPYIHQMPRWQMAIEYALFFGPRFARANRALLDFCRHIRPRVVWIDKGFWVWPSTLAALRQMRALVAGHFTDALFSRSMKVWWLHTLFRHGLPEYDLFFTSMPQDHAYLFPRARPRVELTALGFDDGRFNGSPLATEMRSRWATEMLFAGHWEPRTEAYVVALSEAGLPVTVYGSGWHRAQSPERLKGIVRSRMLSDEEYEYSLKATKIGLGFVSLLNDNQTSGRTFEVAASGTFLLAQRSRQHLECFVEGQEAEFFETPEELVRKARYYLDHPDERQAIAARGHERCLRSDYSWARYMRDDWAKVKAALAGAQTSAKAAAGSVQANL